jgi:hypothetical protein
MALARTPKLAGAGDGGVAVGATDRWNLLAEDDVKDGVDDGPERTDGGDDAGAARD